MPNDDTDIGNPLDFLRSTPEDIEKDKIITPTDGEKDKEKDKKDKSKDKEVQVSELRKAKDKAEKELEELRKKLTEVEETAPLKPVADYLKKKGETVEQFIERQKLRKKELEETKETLKKKDLRVKEISIELSDEFQNDYVQPLNKNKNNLIALIANVNDEGKVKHPQLVTELSNQLLQLDKEGKPLDSVAIKRIITKFESDYLKKTGEEYDIPPLTHVVNGVETVVESFKKMVHAKRDWDTVTEQKKKEQLYNQSVKEKELIKREVDGRNFLFDKAITEYDYKILDGILTKEEFEASAKEVNSYLIDVVQKKEGVKPKGYNDVVIDLTKAKKFDDIIIKYRELEKEIVKEKAKNKSSLRQSSSNANRKDSDRNVVEDDEDPRSMFR